MPRFLKFFLISLLVALAFLAGIYFGAHYYRISPLIAALPDGIRTTLFPGDRLVELLAEVEGIIEENFYQPVDRSQLEDGAMEGLVGSLGDPYAAYMNPDEYRQYVEHHEEGAYVGVGVLLEPKDGHLMVVRTLQGSPAQQAGIQAGDEIVAVDGESIADKVDGEAAALIRGEEGTTVKLTVMRDGRQLDFEIERRSLELPIVREEMLERNGHKVGYIALEQFSLDAGDKVRGAHDRLVADGAEAIILDLRNNGGGILGEAVNVASVFIESGPIVSVVGRDGGEEVYQARGDADQSIPLVVLVNGFTASASEIVAGAVKDDGRGEIVGVTTFGKGVVQNLRPLSNGGAIKYTSGVYYTPLHVNINEIGIEPDVVVEDAPGTPADEALERAVQELIR